MPHRTNPLIEPMQLITGRLRCLREPGEYTDSGRGQNSGRYSLCRSHTAGCRDTVNKGRRTTAQSD
jgi:hypothetical protein